MRESNFDFPAQNRACICISSALYDRRAIDAPSPSLPLINSLTHLAYLTATSPRIREILALDGGLERLVRILKACADGGAPLIEANLGQLKGQGAALAPGSRASPFRPFAEYGTSVAARPDGRKALPLATLSKHIIYTYTLAFQCIVNVGVRGSQSIRTRVVEAGALDVIVNTLECYLKEVERVSAQAEAEWRMLQVAAGQRPAPPLRPLLARLDLNSSSVVNSSADNTPSPPRLVSTPVSTSPLDDSVADDTTSASGLDGDDEVTETEADDLASSSSQMGERGASPSVAAGKPGSSTSPVPAGDAVDHDGDVSMDGDVSRATDDATSTPRFAPPPVTEPIPASAPVQTPSPTSSSSSAHRIQYRDEDVLLSLQLLAYLSKYPHVRSVFHSPSDDASDQPSLQRLPEETAHDHAECGTECVVESTPRQSTSSMLNAAPSNIVPPTLSSNIFSLVERYAHRPPALDRFTPRHSNEVQYWAGVIMRNACRKDETRGGIRQCANMQCGTWEKYPREFAKCRRCRKAKYCSKSCQSKAWQLGHRFWCCKSESKTAASAEVMPVEPAVAVEAVPDAGDLVSDSTPTRSPAPQTAVARRPHLHRSHLQSQTHTRPSTASSMDDDDDEVGQEDDTSNNESGTNTVGTERPRRPSGTPTTTMRLAHRLSTTTLPRGLAHLEGGGGGAGMGMGEGMDENEVAQEMMGGAVFSTGALTVSVGEPMGFSQDA